MPVSPPTFEGWNLSGYMTMSAFSFSFSSTCVRAMMPPMIGMKISADTSDATMTTMMIVGR